MRAGWRPERRNRRIGTINSGRRKQTRMVVPDSRHDEFHFYERLGRHTATEMDVHGQPMTFLGEPVRPGSTYGCSARDVAHVLSHLPADDVAGLKMLVMRQPTRKQEILSAVWGRCVFDAQFGVRRGPAIMLEAVDLSHPIRWDGRLSIEDRNELERLAKDGHQIIRDRRGTTIRVDPVSVRNGVLYRTLLHEVGHWVDWKDRVLRILAASNDPERKQLKSAYFVRPHREREQFANRYADQQAARLRNAGIFPFESLA